MNEEGAMNQQFDENPAVPLWWGGLSAVGMILTVYLIFNWVSTEATMGIVQRIFYFHVPAAMAAFTASFVGGIASILYLVKRDNKYDDLSLAANESVVLFSLVNIVLGSMWAKPIWGIWWTWDARLTSSFLLLFLYASYLVIRKAAPVEQRAVVCAVICILGMADVPLIYLSNRLFRTQHPAPVLGGDANSGMAPDIEKLFFFSIFTMLVFWGLVVRMRRRVARLERVAEDLTRRINELSDVGV
jgi:heme exporter protein C